MNIQKYWIKCVYYGNAKNNRVGGRYKFIEGEGLMVWQKGRWKKIRKECQIISVYLTDKKEYKWSEL